MYRADLIDTEIGEAILKKEAKCIIKQDRLYAASNGNHPSTVIKYLIVEVATRKVRPLCEWMIYSARFLCEINKLIRYSTLIPSGFAAGPGTRSSVRKTLSEDEQRIAAQYASQHPDYFKDAAEAEKWIFNPESADARINDAKIEAFMQEIKKGHTIWQLALSHKLTEGNPYAEVEELASKCSPYWSVPLPSLDYHAARIITSLSPSNLWRIQDDAFFNAIQNVIFITINPVPCGMVHEILTVEGPTMLKHQILSRTHKIKEEINSIPMNISAQLTKILRAFRQAADSGLLLFQRSTPRLRFTNTLDVTPFHNDEEVITDIMEMAKDHMHVQELCRLARKSISPLIGSTPSSSITFVGSEHHELDEALRRTFDINPRQGATISRALRTMLGLPPYSFLEKIANHFYASDCRDCTTQQIQQSTTGTTRFLNTNWGFERFMIMTRSCFMLMSQVTQNLTSRQQLDTEIRPHWRAICPMQMIRTLDKLPSNGPARPAIATINEESTPNSPDYSPPPRHLCGPPRPTQPTRRIRGDWNLRLNDDRNFLQRHAQRRNTAATNLMQRINQQAATDEQADSAQMDTEIHSTNTTIDVTTISVNPNHGTDSFFAEQAGKRNTSDENPAKRCRVDEFAEYVAPQSLESDSSSNMTASTVDRVPTPEQNHVGIRVIDQVLNTGNYNVEVNGTRRIVVNAAGIAKLRAMDNNELDQVALGFRVLHDVNPEFRSEIELPAEALIEAYRGPGDPIADDEVLPIVETPAVEPETSDEAETTADLLNQDSPPAQPIYIPSDEEELSTTESRY
ncbi:unnamed protein product [Oikopleura dioica]|uniref:Uncharacterized protein n=1 Tax=Oikopleura dioica TaxID=34765 RepID=E4YWG8_OIKDI|nr:unnamed protein product [Oikopleura dioica]